MFRRLFSLALLLSLASPALGSQPPVILITIDTVRADRMGFLGSKRGLTPHLDKMARESVVFLNAYAQAPLTTVSHATILTGTYPQFHHVDDFGMPLAAQLPYLPAILRARGYRTAAFVGSIILDPKAGLAPGFDRGFERYDAGYRLRVRNEDRYGVMERRAGDVAARAISWLQRNAGRRFFLWVHVYDPHEPYDPPPPYKTKFAGAPYDGEIAYTDASLGTLFEWLRRHGLYDPALIVVCGDHGEALGQHGEKAHGMFLYQETIRVPLLLKLPRGRMAGKRLARAAALVDIAPTILDEVGARPPENMQGESLLRLLRTSTPGQEPVYSQTDYPARAFGWSPLASLRSGKYLYVRAPRQELYDLLSDPDALTDLSKGSPAVAATMAAQLDDIQRRYARGSPSSAPVLGPEQQQKLAALGYVAVGSTRTAPTADGVDPKDNIEIANLVHEAMMAVYNQRFAEAVPLLERVVAREPQVYIAQFQLGAAYARQKDYVRAVPHLRRATELFPEATMAHYELGIALYEGGDAKASVPALERALALAPRWADAHFSLASVYARSDRVTEAVKELGAALQLDPDHYRANLLLGRILSLQGDAQTALPYLEKSARLQPDSAEAHEFLADAYQRLGNSADEARERKRAGSVRPSHN